MAITSEYCMVKDGVVQNVIVADETFVLSYAPGNGFEAIQRPSMAVGIGHKYHDGKFWRDAPDLDEAGNPTGTTHEEEIA